MDEAMRYVAGGAVGIVVGMLISLGIIKYQLWKLERKVDDPVVRPVIEELYEALSVAAYRFRRIAGQETDYANATVRRMGLIAQEGLSGITTSLTKIRGIIDDPR
jgi:hypothetical protein